MKPSKPLQPGLIRHSGKRRIFLVLFLVLAIGLACNLPFGSTRQETTQPAATNPPLPIIPTPAEVSAPTVVETFPLANSTLPVSGGLALVFDQPMDRGSVEGALKVEPASPGRFEWVDDFTVRFVPDQPFALQTAVTISVDMTARAQNGKTLLRPAVFAFQTSPGLRITERLPAPQSSEVDPSSAIAITFNRPVVKLGADTTGQVAAFSFLPAVEGQGRWLNTSTYIFYPEPALMGGSTYTVQVNPALTSLDGAPLQAGQAGEWTFETASPALIDFGPVTENEIGLDTSFMLRFNQPMDRVNVESGFQILDGQGNRVPGKYDWEERDSQVTFTPDGLLQRSTNYQVNLLAVRSRGGAVLDRAYIQQYRSVGNLAVVRTIPRDGQSFETYGGFGSMVITFNAALAERQNLRQLVRLDPEPSTLYLSMDSEQRSIYISGYFQSGQRYNLTLSGALEDQWGSRLGQDLQYSFVGAASEPALSVPMIQAGSSILYALPGERSLAANATNLQSLNLQRSRLTLADFIRAVGLNITSDGFTVEESWQRLLELPENTNQSIEIGFRSDGEGLEAGLYAFRIDSPQLGRQFSDVNFLLVVSPVQLTLKESDTELLVWATDLENGRVVSNRTVTVFDASGNTLGRATSNGDGIARISLSEQRERYQTLIAVLGEPGDGDFSVATTAWNSGISPWSYGLITNYFKEPNKAYLYTDRPIYQPGQTVYFKGVLRKAGDARYQPLDLKEAVFLVYGAYSEEIGDTPLLYTLRLPVSPYGTVHGEFILPDNALPGKYSLQVQGQPNHYFEFTVADYRKPEIDLEVSFRLPEVRLGQDIQAEIAARYFFGEPAANVMVNWSLYARRDYHWLREGYFSGLADTSWMDPMAWMFPESFMGQYLTGGSAMTGVDGRLPLTFLGSELENWLEKRDPRTLVLEATLVDESGQPVSRRGESKIHPAGFYIGIRNEVWAPPAGTAIQFSISTSDWRENPSGNQELSAVFEKVEWIQDWSNIETGDVQFREVITQVSSANFRTDGNGRANLEFTPEEPGSYRLDVRGGGAVSQILVWVGGPGSAPWPVLPNQHLRLEADRQVYQVSDTARIFLPNPYPQTALALVTVERSGILRSNVMQITGSSTQVEIPILEEDAPNVFVSVTLLGYNGDGRADFRQGYVELEVDPSFLELDVSLTPVTERLEPGAAARFEIQVRDNAGSPVQGEFSLAAVDKAVLALIDQNSVSILEAFYGRQPLGVLTSTSLAVYTGRIPFIPPGMGGGGGGDRSLTPQLRSDFQDTAYWVGAFETDSSGRASIEFPVPDNLTTWVVTIRGLTRDTRVGESTTEVVVSKDLLVRPVTPRFLVVGDRVQIGAVVHNNTTASLEVTVSLQAGGVVLEDPGQATQVVEVIPGGRARVNWWVNVQDRGHAELIFRAQGGGLQDASTPTSGEIPILRYVSPQTFGTSGILPEKGDVLEVVSLPRSFTPSGGELRIEMTPNLAGTILSGLDALEGYNLDFSEAVLSRLLANLSAYELARVVNLQSPDLSSRLQAAIRTDLNRLTQLQKADGGWGWSAWQRSDPFLTTYAVLVLDKASAAGYFVDLGKLERAVTFVEGSLYAPGMANETWELDRLAFIHFTLNQGGRSRMVPQDLVDLRARLNPWAQAFLALALKTQDAEMAATIFSDLGASASRSGTGANWQDGEGSWQNFSNPLSTTAIVVYALADSDPASPLLSEAIRYLMAHRRAAGGWWSSFDTAWVLAGLTRAALATGELQANFAYTAELNGAPLAGGQAAGVESFNPVRATVPISELVSSGNLLKFQRSDGEGRLYYRAFLEVGRPVESIEALDRGLIISREYFLAGEDCQPDVCTAIVQADLMAANPVVNVRVSVTVPEDMYYLVVEDFIPAGAEIVDASLNTAQLGTGSPETIPSQPVDLMREGWGWWYFSGPRIYHDHLQWVGSSVPAGTYVLTYRLTLQQAGEYRVLPARAYAYYFPETEGRSQGMVFKIE